MNFENTVSRFRKVSEHIAELSEIVDALKAERDALEAEALGHCFDHMELYNVFTRKNSCAGLVGREFFRVTFASRVERRGAKARLDDQEWLSTLSGRYVKRTLALQPSVVRAELSSGALTDAALCKMGLRLGTKATLSVKRIPNDAELAKVREDAAALVGDAQ